MALHQQQMHDKKTYYDICIQLDYLLSIKHEGNVTTYYNIHGPSTFFFLVKQDTKGR